MPNPKGPFDRRQHTPSYCKSCTCSEFLAANARGNSKYTGTERCLACPHRANDHIWEDTEQLPQPLPASSSSTTGILKGRVLEEDENFRLASSPIQKLVSRRTSRSARASRIAPIQESSPVSASSPEQPPTSSPAKTPSPSPGSHSTLLSSPLPVSSSPEPILSSPPPELPLPITGRVTVEKLYKYLIARNDHSDSLHTRLLKHHRAHAQETETLLNGLYLDLAAVREEAKEIKKTVDEIAANYWKEQLAMGRYAVSKTPVKEPLPEERTWKTLLESRTGSKKGSPESGKVTMEWQKEFEKLRKQDTPVVVSSDRSGVSSSVGTRDGGGDRTLATAPRVGLVYTVAPLGRKAGMGGPWIDAEGSDSSVLQEESELQEFEESGNSGGEQQFWYGEERQDNYEQEEEEEGEEGEEGEVGEDGQWSLAEDEEISREDEDEDSDDEDPGEEEDESEGGDESEDEGEDEDEGVQDEDEDEEDSGPTYYEFFGKIRPVRQLYSGTLPLLTPVTEESLSSPRKNFSSPMKGMLFPKPSPLKGEEHTPSTKSPLSRELLLSKEESEEIDDEAEREAILSLLDQYKSSPLATPHLHSSSPVSSLKYPDGDYSTPTKKRKRQPDTPESQRAQKRLHVEQLRDSLKSQPNGSRITPKWDESRSSDGDNSDIWRKLTSTPEGSNIRELSADDTRVTPTKNANMEKTPISLQYVDTKVRKARGKTEHSNIDKPRTPTHGSERKSKRKLSAKKETAKDGRKSI